MTSPNTLIFVDLMSDDPVKAGKFYAAVMGWEDDVRMDGQFCRMVPGGNFKNPDGSDSEIGNLHIGIGDVANLRPNPDPTGGMTAHLVSVCEVIPPVGVSERRRLCRQDHDRRS